MSDRTLIFVYGSLRRGGWNEGYLASGAEFVGPARTAGRCALYVCPTSGLPYMTFDAVSRIVGELYSVDDATLADLDALEGHPDSYLRTPVEIETAAGEVTEAQVYVWLHDTTDLELVPSGDWFDTLDVAYD